MYKQKRLFLHHYIRSKYLLPLLMICCGVVIFFLISHKSSVNPQFYKVYNPKTT